MRYWKLFNATEPDKPLGLVKFDEETLVPAYFSRKGQTWVEDGDLFSVVLNADSEPATEISEAEAELILNTVLTSVTE